MIKDSVRVSMEKLDDLAHNPNLSYEMQAMLGDPCPDCRHYGVEHLLYLGALKLCMTAGCACGRRLLIRLARAVAPWCPVLAVWAYLAWHFVLGPSRAFWWGR